MAEVEGGGWVLLRFGNGDLVWLLQFLEQAGAQGGLELALQTRVLEYLVQLLPEKHRIGDLRHILNQQLQILSAAIYHLSALGHNHSSTISHHQLRHSKP